MMGTRFVHTLLPALITLESKKLFTEATCQTSPQSPTSVPPIVLTRSLTSAPLCCRTRQTFLSYSLCGHIDDKCSIQRVALIGLLVARVGPTGLSMAEQQQQQLPPTKLAYFDDTFLFDHSGCVLAVVSQASAGSTSTALVFDSTVFHPAGGGQPADEGVVASLNGEGAEVAVIDVRMRDGVVYHTLAGAPPPWLMVGVQVRQKVNEERRLLHARLHSAGHLLDVCMAQCGYPSSVLVPTKGQHTPAESYVEYDGKVPPTDRDGVCTFRLLGCKCRVIENR
jgi:hypothetical protein